MERRPVGVALAEVQSQPPAGARIALRRRPVELVVAVAEVLQPRPAKMPRNPETSRRKSRGAMPSCAGSLPERHGPGDCAAVPQSRAALDNASTGPHPGVLA